jgi:signal peptidase II
MPVTEKPFLTSLAGLPGILALAVMGLDHLTKWLVRLAWPVPGEGEFIVIPGFFKLVHWRNLGAAWGILDGRTWLLAMVSLLAALALIIFFRRFTEGKPVYAIPAGVLLGGIAGNFIDRALFPEGVVDFLAFRWWPAFNVADSAICCSVIFLVVVNLLAGWKKSGGEKTADE